VSAPRADSQRIIGWPGAFGGWTAYRRSGSRSSRSIRSGNASVGAAAGHHAGVLRRELAALEGGRGGRHRGQLAGQADLGVGGAGADVELVGEPGGAGQAQCLV